MCCFQPSSPPPPSRSCLHGLVLRRGRRGVSLTRPWRCRRPRGVPPLRRRRLCCRGSRRRCAPTAAPLRAPRFEAVWAARVRWRAAAAGGTPAADAGRGAAHHRMRRRAHGSAAARCGGRGERRRPYGRTDGPRASPSARSRAVAGGVDEGARYLHGAAAAARSAPLLRRGLGAGSGGREASALVRGPAGRLWRSGGCRGLAGRSSAPYAR